MSPSLNSSRLIDQSLEFIQFDNDEFTEVQEDRWNQDEVDSLEVEE